ncbi:MAG: Fe-S cluster assembly protein SufD [Halieaceae bacterium]|nr:Fe-S cluster assembly protein SufD [Halieaceae bacterium]
MKQPLAEASRRVPHWLQSIQARGVSHWGAAALPTRRTENWKYTSLQALRDDYRLADPSAPSPDALPAALREGFGGPRLVFVDGVFQSELSDLSQLDGAEGVSVCRFDEASPEQADRIAEYLDSCFDPSEHQFAALNTATLRDGVFVDLADGARLAAPLHVLWLLRAADGPVAMSQRLLVLAGANSDATLVEQFVAMRGAAASFCSGVTELRLGPGAHLDHYRLHEEEGEAVHIGAVHARLDRDSRLESFHLALGSSLKRIDVNLRHDGPGAHADLNGIYLPRGDEHIDYHTTIDHAVPHCSSDEVFRGIIADRATAVFNGRIHIHPDAQKTRAELSNKNLLTSTEAEVNTKPELEIYADDVSCAHGATVAQLDAEALHYLRTRGVSRDEAEVMLSFGFINELVDGVALEALRTYLKPRVAARFARDETLMRHIL